MYEIPLHRHRLPAVIICGSEIPGGGSMAYGMLLGVVWIVCNN